MSASAELVPLLRTTPQPHVLTIAGSDSGGGAGIQADLKTIAAFGCYGSSVITALTAQNTLGVQGVHAVPTDFVVQQLTSILSDDMRPLAIKFGMLTSAETISALATTISALPSTPYLVCDPVMISTSGATLLPDSAAAALVTHLLPVCDLVTPNIPEALALVRAVAGVEAGEPTGVGAMVFLARRVRDETRTPAVLLKGGHLTLSRADVVEAVRDAQYAVTWDEGADVEVIDNFRGTLGLERSADVVVDVLVDRAGVHLFIGRKIESSSTHGTGCTLSAALASMYATEAGACPDAFGADNDHPRTLSCDGVRRAIAYTQSAIAAAHPLGRGNGPLNHYHLTQPRALPAPTAENPTPFTAHLIAAAGDLWHEYVRHPFVVQLGQGSLPQDAFKHYIAQDYHYLRHYARAHALGAYKATDFETIGAFTAIAQHIAKESEMHVAYCTEFGLTLADLHATPESAACSAYARYILDVGTQGDILDVYVAVASCLIGYGEVGLWLRSRVSSGDAVLDGNPYKRWMDDYAGDEFMGAVQRGIANLEARVARDPPSPAKLRRLTQIWVECVRLERDFWEMGLRQSW